MNSPEPPDRHDRRGPVAPEAETPATKRVGRKCSALTGLPQWGVDEEARAWDASIRAQRAAHDDRREGIPPWTRRRPLFLMVFDDVITGTTSVHTLADLDDLLASRDVLAIEAVASQVEGTSPRLVIELEHSSNRVHWLPKDAVPAIDVALDPSATTVATGTSTDPAPLLGYARLRMELSAASGTPTARLRVHIVGRSR